MLIIVFISFILFSFIPLLINTFKMKKFKVTLTKKYKGTDRNQIRYINLKHIKEFINFYNIKDVIKLEEV